MDPTLLLFLFIYFTILIHVVVDLYFDAINESHTSILHSYVKDGKRDDMTFYEWADHVRTVNNSYQLFRESRT